MYMFDLKKTRINKKIVTKCLVEMKQAMVHTPCTTEPWMLALRIENLFSSQRQHRVMKDYCSRWITEKSIFFRFFRSHLIHTVVVLLLHWLTNVESIFVCQHICSSLKSVFIFSFNHNCSSCERESEIVFSCIVLLHNFSRLAIAQYRQRHNCWYCCFCPRVCLGRTVFTRYY